MYSTFLPTTNPKTATMGKERREEKKEEEEEEEKEEETEEEEEKEGEEEKEAEAGECCLWGSLERTSLKRLHNRIPDVPCVFICRSLYQPNERHVHVCKVTNKSEDQQQSVVKATRDGYKKHRPQDPTHKLHCTARDNSAEHEALVDAPLPF
ncbi:unnamed protein product [Prorocentrum cordatum]|uniref:Uncharacterized protein n=1 Tax=Prorocentrum cordatum TaxID=2364126 RepID=A0ABN9U312_9DINO|nr:unnamed protein product [Polarella glacialis]